MFGLHQQPATKKAKFKVGQSVFLDYSTKNEKIEPEGAFIISKVTFQPMTRIYMYQFEGQGIAVGEIYLKKNKEDKKLTIKECFDEPEIGGTSKEDLLDTFASVNRLMGSMQCASDGGMGVTFFDPDDNFVKWIKNYAGNRIIVDVGCGTGRLTYWLHAHGGRVIGIDPMLDHEGVMKKQREYIMNGESFPHFIPKKIQDSTAFFKGHGSKVLLICARPSHGNYVVDTLDLKDSDTELLYITKPNVMDDFNDLGKYKKLAVEIPHEGRSPEQEKVWSIK